MAPRGAAEPLCRSNRTLQLIVRHRVAVAGRGRGTDGMQRNDDKVIIVLINAIICRCYHARPLLEEEGVGCRGRGWWTVK